MVIVLPFLGCLMLMQKENALEKARHRRERARDTRAFDGGIWNAITNQQAQFFSSVFSGPRKIFFLMGRDGEDDEDLPSLSVYVHPRGSLRAADARGHMAVDD